MRTLGRRVRGVAMLELILVLPVYMLLIFVLVSLAEYGQVATQLQLAARYATWRSETPGTAAGVFLRHFEPRCVAGGTGVMVPVLRFDGSEQGFAIPAVGSITLSGAAAYANGAMPDALFGAQGALLPSIPVQTKGLSLSAQTQADLIELTHMALDGDTLQPLGTEGIPWLRRRYAVMTAQYTPMGHWIPTQQLQVYATVLVPRSYGSAQPTVYPADAVLPSTLRATAAAPIPPATSPVIGTRPGGHQMKMLHTPQYLDHSATPPMP